MQAVSRRTALVTIAGAAGALATGCAVSRPEGTSARETSAAAAPTTPATTQPPTPTPTEDTRVRAPLTGEVIDDPAALAHAAVAVKVSDVQSAHPQYGLNEADIVFAEPNGVSYIRLCAVFHTRFAESVGPVRSIRPVDVPLLSPLKPVFGNTAAANWVLHYVESFRQHLENLYSFKAGVHGTGAYTTFPHRARVHSVCCHPDKLRQLATQMTQPPAAPYLPFAVGDERPSTELSGKAARVISVQWGPGDTWNTSYHYDKATQQYLRDEPWGEHVLADGQRVRTDNVIVIRARWRMDKIYVGTGAPDPVVDIINATGTFVYAHQGSYVTGTWSKGAVDELFEFTLDDGTPLTVAPGRTFIELPQFDADVKFTA